METWTENGKYNKIIIINTINNNKIIAQTGSKCLFTRAYTCRHYFFLVPLHALPFPFPLFQQNALLGLQRNKYRQLSSFELWTALHVFFSVASTNCCKTARPAIIEGRFDFRIVVKNERATIGSPNQCLGGSY